MPEYGHCVPLLARVRSGKSDRAEAFLFKTTSAQESLNSYTPDKELLSWST